jgi:hypothetical protein
MLFPVESVRHYFFRLNEQDGSICWSRSREGAFRNPSKALVLQVHKGPSNTVKKIPKFSPNDLHCYTFWVETGGGVLDLFAYNEDSFRLWVMELEGMALRNSSAVGHDKFKNSSVHSRPSSSLSVRSRASVMPADGDHLTEMIPDHSSSVTAGSSSGRVDFSIFTTSTEPQQPLQLQAAVKNAAFSVGKRAQIAPSGSPGSFPAKPASSTTVQHFIGGDRAAHITDPANTSQVYSGDII